MPGVSCTAAPENDEIVHLTDTVRRRVKAFLERRSIGGQPDCEQADPLSESGPGMAVLLANSVRSRIAQRGDQVDADPIDPFESPRCALVSGFSIHANTCIDGRDRLRLERLLRYCLRPAVSMERLTELPYGRLAPATAWRPLIIPFPERNSGNSAAASPSHSVFFAQPGPDPDPLEAAPESIGRNYRWAELMKRVFLVDVLQCENCGGPMKMIAAIDRPELIEKILRYVGLISHAPPSAAAHAQTHR